VLEQVLATTRENFFEFPWLEAHLAHLFHLAQAGLSLLLK
jgi:hypothetical protein